MWFHIVTMDFAERIVKWFKQCGIAVESSKPTLFESTLARLSVKHRLIRPYTPRHNGKAERSHREEHNKFYSLSQLLLPRV